MRKIFVTYIRYYAYPRQSIISRTQINRPGIRDLDDIFNIEEEIKVDLYNGTGLMPDMITIINWKMFDE